MASYKYNTTGMSGGSAINSQVVGSNYGNMELNVTLEGIEKIEDATKKEIKALTGRTIHVSALDKVLEMLDKGIHWITIVGHPGEGKTTLGYMVLEHLQKSGIGTRVFRVDTPAHFEKLLGCDDCVIMLNDTFGSFTFDPAKLAEWEQLIHRVIDLQKNTSEGSKVARVIFISRWNVLNVAKSQLERYSENILDQSCVVNLSTGNDVQEKRKMLNFHLEKANIKLSPEIIQGVVESETPHGFPHCCQIYVELCQKYSQEVDIVKFFSCPLEFLDKTTQVLISKKDCYFFALFKNMIAGDGQLDIFTIENDEQRSQLKDVSDELMNSYLVYHNSRIAFSHPSIHESVAHAVARKDIKFFLESASISFLRQKIHIVEEGQAFIKGYINFKMNEHLIKILVRRFSDHILVKKKFDVFTSRLAENLQFCKSLVERTFHPSSESTPVSDRQTLGVNEPDVFGQTPLFYSVSHGRKTLLTHLVKFGADVDLQVPKNSLTCLQYLCSRDNPDVDVLKLLMKYNADVNVQDKYGCTPLLYLHGRCNQDVEVVKLLLEHKADVNLQDSFGWTFLHHLCNNTVNPKVEVIKLLLEHNADVNIQDKCGETPLHRLYDRGNPDVEVVNLLLEHKADVNLRATNGFSLLHRLCYEINSDVDYVKLLLEHKADVNLQAWKGETPLHFLCDRDKPDVEILKLLLEHKADVNLQDEKGWTPHHRLCYGGNPDVEVVKLLLEHKIDVSLQTKYGWTPLHRLCYEGNPDVEVVKLLLEHEVDVNLLDLCGKTALDILCDRHPEDVEIVRLLRKHKADVNLQDTDGSTPLHRQGSGDEPQRKRRKLLQE